MTLGLSIFNPGNIRFSPHIVWQGQSGERGGFVIFETVQDGIRAISKILINYQHLDSCHTVRQIITRWAPPSDNNPTEQYITNVATHMEVNPDTPIDLNANSGLLTAMIEAIIKQEQGSQPYSDEIIVAGIESALAA